MSPALLAHKARQEPLVLLDLKVLRVTLERPAPLVLKALRVQKESLAWPLKLRS